MEAGMMGALRRAVEAAVEDAEHNARKKPYSTVALQVPSRAAGVALLARIAAAPGAAATDTKKGYRCVLVAPKGALGCQGSRGLHHVRARGGAGGAGR